MTSTENTHRTSYMAALIHLFKGNFGIGLFAMGDAYKNGGLIVAFISTIIIAIICVHCQHILLECSKTMKLKNNLSFYPDYAETVGESFRNWRISKNHGGDHFVTKANNTERNSSNIMKTIVNTFICITQLGFCCIYFVFTSETVQQILRHHNIIYDFHSVVPLLIIPILIPSLITNLKYLTPISLISNLLMTTGLIITMYYIFEMGLPTAAGTVDYYTDFGKLSLYFGTVIFAFEGIALVLPLQNSMKIPENFDKNFGVLNVGMLCVASIYTLTGLFGYLKWGNDVEGSLTLNLDTDLWLAQLAKVGVAAGIVLTYPLQLFVAIQIMWPHVENYIERNFTNGISHSKNNCYYEIIFRLIVVIITFGIAELVPKLNLFISLIGALCSTTLALVFPPIIAIMAILNENNVQKLPQSYMRYIFIFKNICIFLLAIIGFATGTYHSIYKIISEFSIY